MDKKKISFLYQGLCAVCRLTEYFIISKLLSLEKLGSYTLFNSYLLLATGLIGCGLGTIFASRESNQFLSKKNDFYFSILNMSIFLSPILVFIGFLLKIPFFNQFFLLIWFYLISESANSEIQRYQYTLGKYESLSFYNLSVSISHLIVLTLSIIFFKSPISWFYYFFLSLINFILQIFIFKVKINNILLKFRKTFSEFIKISKYDFLSKLKNVFLIFKVGTKEIIHQQFISLQNLIDRYLIEMLLGNVALSIFNLIQVFYSTLLTIFATPFYSEIRKNIVNPIFHGRKNYKIQRNLNKFSLLTIILFILLIPLPIILLRLLIIDNFQIFINNFGIYMAILAVLTGTLNSVSSQLSPRFSLSEGLTRKIITAATFLTAFTILLSLFLQEYNLSPYFYTLSIILFLNSFSQYLIRIRNV